MYTSERLLFSRRKAGVLMVLLAGSLAAVATLPVQAGSNAAAVQALRGDNRDADPAPRREERRSERPAPRVERSQGPSQAQGQPPAQAAQRGPAMAEQRSGGDFRSGNLRNRGGEPVVVGPPRGPQGPDARIVAPSRAYQYDRGPSRDFSRRPPPPDRIVPRLGAGYRSYSWGGSPYYQHQGRWYRPYGSSYVIVGAPYGLFVPYLPGYYSTFWFGGSRYYMADDTYYMYEPQRRGYVVTRSPYGSQDEDEDSGDESQAAPELYVYPTRGQSEKQQADDRYECHRWAADQAHYDPTDSEYRADDRQQYDRALTACLTGRGYSVK